MKSFTHSKRCVLDFYTALEQANSKSIKSILNSHLAPDFYWYGVYPFDEQRGPDAVAEVFWIPFLNSWTNVQRRQDIFLAGTNEIDQMDWVISMGHLMGLLDQDWLGMKASRKLAFSQGRLTRKVLGRMA